MADNHTTPVMLYGQDANSNEEVREHLQFFGKEKNNTSTERKPLPIGTVIRPNSGNEEIEILEVIGEGASCIAYVVNVRSKDGISKKKIMKEVYPKSSKYSYPAKRIGYHLMVAAGDYDLHLRREKERFIDTFHMQNQLQQTPQLSSLIVNPSTLLEAGNITPEDIPAGYIDYTTFALYENDFSGSLQKKKNDHGEYNLSGLELLELSSDLAHALGQLHEYGKYLYVDIEPNNILYSTEKEKKEVKLFDFDAALPLEDRIKQKNLKSDDLRGNTERIQADEFVKLTKTALLGQNAHHYLDPVIDIHNAAAMLFKLFTGKEYTEEQLQEGVCALERELLKKKEIYSRCTNAEIRKLAEILYMALKHADNPRDMIKNANAGEMLYQYFTGDALTDEQRQEKATAYTKALWKNESICSRWNQEETKKLAGILYDAIQNPKHLKEILENRDSAIVLFTLVTGNAPSQEQLAKGAGAFVTELLRCKKLFLRYTHAKEMSSDLDSLIQSVRNHSPIGKEYSSLNGTVAAAALLDAYPLFQYCHKDNKKEMHVGIIGSHEIAKTLFKTMLGSVLMLDKSLHIHWAVENPEQFLKEWVEEEPQLKLVLQLLNVKCNDQKMNCNFDEPLLSEKERKGYTEDYFANVSFDTLDLQTVPWFKRSIPTKNRPYWIAVLNQTPDQNAAYVTLLRKTLKNYKSLIAYGGDEPEREPDGNITLVPFACRDYKYIKTFERTNRLVELRARAVNAMYQLDGNDKAANIEDSFTNSPYNIRSSIACALSIPYKLDSLGINPFDPHAANKYYDRVVGKKANAEDQQKIMYLEHWRWTVFMLLEGYRCPDLDTLKGYMYAGKNDHRLRTGAIKYHPCLRAMQKDAIPSGKTPLSKLSKKAWMDADLSEYDPLDQMSLQLHRFAEEKVKERADEILQDCDGITTIIRKNVDTQGFWMHTEEPVQLCQDFRDLLENEINEVVGTRQLLLATIAKLKNFVSEQANIPAETEAAVKIQEALARIERNLKVVYERNKYHDYKASDEAIIRNIPWILDAGTIQEIRKPVTGTLFYDTFSTMVLRPQKLSLIGASMDYQKEVAEILENRNIPTEVVAMEQFAEEENAGDGILVDLSGNDTQTVYEYATGNKKRKYPLLTYSAESNGLLGLRKADNIQFRTILPKLDVPETIRLNRGSQLNVLAGMSPDKMHDSVDTMMQIAEDMGGDWASFVNMLSAIIRRATQFHLYGKPEIVSETVFSRKKISHVFIEGSHLKEALDDLMNAGLIDSYELPVRNGNLMITSSRLQSNSLQSLVEWISQQLMETPGSDSHFIFDSNLKNFCNETVFCHFKESLNVPQNKRVITDERILIRGLTKLYTAVNKHGENIILENLLESGQVVQKNSIGYEIYFRGVDAATLSCFENSGAILEAYTYHSIRRSVDVDDIRMNVIISWDKNLHDMSQLSKAVNNELDVIFTKDAHSYFVSCKMQKVEVAHLHEIRYLTDQFGINGTPILVASGNVDMGTVSVGNRAKEMGIYLIDRSKLKNLGRYIANIVEGKENWEDITEN